MRLPQHDGQNPLPLHENATRISCPQPSQRNRAKPRAMMPQKRNSRSSRSTKAGRPSPPPRALASSRKVSARGARDAGRRPRGAGARTGAIRNRSGCRPARRFRASSPPRGGVMSGRRARPVDSRFWRKIVPSGCFTARIRSAARAECGHLDLGSYGFRARFATPSRSRAASIRTTCARGIARPSRWAGTTCANSITTFSAARRSKPRSRIRSGRSSRCAEIRTT
jgi:hypothetical protein